MNRDREDHQRRIVEQFTRQAVPFAQMPAHSQEEANRLVLATIGVTPQDTVLDVACGPGLTSCALAAVARHVTGIDLTPAMIDEAQRQQHSKGLTNLAWRVGDVQALPFDDAAFSLIFTRYSFHHLLAPQAVLAEMVRVCTPGGKVAVVDVFTTTVEQAQAFDRVEQLRDPSHTHALLLEELSGLFGAAGLQNVRTAFYKLEVALEELLEASGTPPSNREQIRQIFEEDLEHHRLGVDTQRKDGILGFSFPIVVLVGSKA